MFTRIFPLHDRTRRAVCRGIFVLFALAPTLAAAAWSVARQLPLEARRIERTLSRELMCRVGLSAVEHPSPGKLVLRNVSLNDQETSSPLAECSRVDVAWHSGAVAIRADEAEMNSAAIRALSRWAELRLKRGASDNRPVHWFAGEVLIQDDDGQLRLTDLHGGAVVEEAAAQVSVRFRCTEHSGEESDNVAAGSTDASQTRGDSKADTNADDYATLRILRRQGASGPVTQIEWQSGATAIPCSLLASHFPTAEWLGADARYQGYVWATETDDGWDAEMAGVATGLDLEHLVSRRFPHQLTGTATLRIERARITGGRVQSASGSLESYGGMVSRSLLESASRSLRMGWGVPDEAVGILPYAQLAVGFSIDQSGLVIRGQCPAAPRAVVIDQRHVLLEQPAEQQPVAALIRTLVPHRDVQVPASYEAQWLVARLPLSRVVAPWNNEPPPAP